MPAQPIRDPVTCAKLTAVVDGFAAVVMRWSLSPGEADALVDAEPSAAAALIAGRLDPTPLFDRLVMVIEVDIGMLILLGDALELRRWLRAPSTALSGGVPLHVMCRRGSNGMHRVHEMVRAELPWLGA